MKKKYCDWGHLSSRVKILPVGGGANAIICRDHFYAEMRFRDKRNRELEEDRFSIFKWKELKDWVDEPRPLRRHK